MKTIIIPISSDDETEVHIEDWPDGLLCLKLKHKNRYLSVLLDSDQATEVVSKLIAAGTEKFGRLE